jgi:streptogramin lyase
MNDSRLFTGTCISLAVLAGVADAKADYTWKYYRPGNTGVMGDFSDALWIDPDGVPYHCGYDPHFEEGGFAKFIEAENRWINFSNVDYPVIGSSENVGAARVSDIVPDASGALWMGTWRGALYFDPAVGPDSLVRFDAGNSPIPGGRTMDVDVAPDGSVWFACYGNGGGLARYEPGPGTWTVWDSGSSQNGWPGWTTLDTAVVQPNPAGGYLVWIDDAFGLARFDSDTQLFTVLPNNDVPGEIESVLPNATDDMGNTWMLRYSTPGQLYTLEYRRTDGTWVAPPMPFAGAIELSTFRASGDRQALMIGGDNEAFRFDGTSWSSLGQWRPGGFTYAIDMDDVGNVWVSGSGGAARRDAATGVWQRYRITNTGQIDNFIRDLSLAPNGDVWVTGNAGPGVGGIGVFDGERWNNHNILTYGLGEEWPFPTDNADAITFRASTGNVAFNPMFNGIREWDGEDYTTLDAGSTSDGLVEDSLGRLWTMGNYYNLRYHDGDGFTDVSIDGWGANVVRDPDRPGTVWACANFEVVRTDGDYRFSREVPDFHELEPRHDVLTTVAAAPGGVAWVGSTEGLIRVDANTGTHEWFHSSNSDMPGDQVTPLAVTPDGRVWFTNFNSQGIEASLVWYDGERFGTITRAQGLPHAQIYDAEVREVAGGYELWLACASRGIAVLTVTSDCPADFNADGVVNSQDFVAFLNAFATGDPSADFNADGIVNSQDFVAFLNAFVAGC